jgi:hypothetical protein
LVFLHTVWPGLSPRADSGCFACRFRQLESEMQYTPVALSASELLLDSASLELPFCPYLLGLQFAADGDDRNTGCIPWKEGPLR